MRVIFLSTGLLLPARCSHRDFEILSCKKLSFSTSALVASGPHFTMTVKCDSASDQTPTSFEEALNRTGNVTIKLCFDYSFRKTKNKYLLVLRKWH